MTASSPGTWAVTACRCGCGTVAPHFFGEGLPSCRIVMEAAQASEMAIELARAAEVAFNSRDESRATVDHGSSEARH